MQFKYTCIAENALKFNHEMQNKNSAASVNGKVLDNKAYVTKFCAK